MSEEHKQVDTLLSTADVTRFDEITLDRQAAKLMFNQFITRHHNMLRNIEERSAKMWEHCLVAYGLDVEKNYSTFFSKEEGRLVIRSIGDRDE